MKARILRDNRGTAVASIIDSVADAGLVPLDVELDDGGTSDLEEVSLRTRDLFDLDDLHKRFAK